MTLLWLALCLGVALYVVLGFLARRRRGRLGLDTGALVGADDSRLAAPTLRSARLGLVGRPDHLLRSGRFLIPVEHKPRAQRVQQSYILQVAAQCALVQETSGVRPPYGVLVLADGISRQVPFTPELEQRLLRTMARMREMLATEAEPGPRWVAPKCRACSFRTTCWD